MGSARKGKVSESARSLAEKGASLQKQGTDVMSPQQRYRAMRSNRGRTRPEKALASLLWREGFRFLTADGYRGKYGKRLLGQPDLIFTRKKIIVFVDGCFWHGCRRCHDFEKDCDRFWQDKIQVNVERDRRITSTLRGNGWTVMRVWEHDLRRKGDLKKTASRLSRRLQRLKRKA